MGRVRKTWGGTNGGNQNEAGKCDSKKISKLCGGNNEHCTWVVAIIDDECGKTRNAQYGHTIFITTLTEVCLIHTNCLCAWILNCFHWINLHCFSSFQIDFEYFHWFFIDVYWFSPIFNHLNCSLTSLNLLCWNAAEGGTVSATVEAGAKAGDKAEAKGTGQRKSNGQGKVRGIWKGKGNGKGRAELKAGKT